MFLELSSALWDGVKDDYLPCVVWQSCQKALHLQPRSLLFMTVIQLPLMSSRNVKTEKLNLGRYQAVSEKLIVLNADSADPVGWAAKPSQCL